MKPRYTFSTKGTDGNLYYPKKPGDQTTGWVADWTTDISKAMTWEKPEDFDCVMAEYEDTQVVTVFEGDKMIDDETESKTLDVKVYLPVMKTLVKVYGDFKVSPELHNYIIDSLASICEAIEQENPGVKK